MLSNIKEKSSISLISFIDAHVVNPNTADSINIADKAAKPLLIENGMN